MKFKSKYKTFHSRKCIVCEMVAILSRGEELIKMPDVICGNVAALRVFISSKHRNLLFLILQMPQAETQRLSWLCNAHHPPPQLAIAKTLGPTSIAHRSDDFTPDRFLTSVRGSLLSVPWMRLEHMRHTRTPARPHPHMNADWERDW